MGTLNDPTSSQINTESSTELILEQRIAENESQNKMLCSQNLLNLTTTTNLSNTTTTNSCSSTNSLHLTEEEEESEESEDYEHFNEYELNHHKTKKNQSQLIVTSIELVNPATIGLIRNNQTNSSSSSSSSSTTSSNSSTTSAHIVTSKGGSNHEIAQTQLSNEKLQQHTNKYIFILNGFVNGFAQLKLSADKTDYEYIIEVYWSNDTKSFIKRTYDDFVRFHTNLLQSFSQFFNELANKKHLCKNSSTLSNSICNLTTISTSKSNNCARSSFCSNGHMMPLLPAKKKPFWISHLKLAESREIELNTYVQAILNLPIKISHSPMVLKFFESQPSDPKPSRIGRTRNYDNNVESSEIGSDSNEEYRDDDIDDSDADAHDNPNLNPTLNNINISSIKSNKNSNKIDYLSKVELEDDEEIDEDQDDEDEDEEYENFNNYYDSLENNSNKRIKQINSNGFSVNGLTRIKKRVEKEAGLWWDEDMALNELTSSMSFDFDSQYHLQSPVGVNGCGIINEFKNKNSFFTRKLQEHDDVVTLKTLESMHSNNNESDKSSKENIISSSSTSIMSASKTGENLIRRLSLS